MLLSVCLCARLCAAGFAHMLAVVYNIHLCIIMHLVFAFISAAVCVCVCSVDWYWHVVLYN